MHGCKLRDKRSHFIPEDRQRPWKPSGGHEVKAANLMQSCRRSWQITQVRVSSILSVLVPSTAGLATVFLAPVFAGPPSAGEDVRSRSELESVDTNSNYAETLKQGSPGWFGLGFGLTTNPHLTIVSFSLLAFWLHVVCFLHCCCGCSITNFAWVEQKETRPRIREI